MLILVGEVSVWQKEAAASSGEVGGFDWARVEMALVGQRR